MTTDSTEVTTCTWCGTPMTADLLGDQLHPGCGDPIQLPAAVNPEMLGPCVICGQITTRYGDTSTLCPACQAVTTG